ncbi:MAG: Omp28-related outer membrane protein, partial [Bacteroidia bacterium]
VLGSVFSISSCDFVTLPQQAGSGADTTTTTVHRKVLLEDYTGHKCPNCPAAATAANAIVAANGNNVIVMGVHAGFFADTATSGTEFRADFKTAAGTAYDLFFGISNAGNPNGMVNRKDYTPSTITHIKNYGTWPTEVAAELATPATAKVEIVNSYNSGTHVLDCTIKSTFLYDTLTGGPYKMIAVIVQDSIISDQQVLAVYTPNYVHEHVLRDNLNGTWGDNLVTGTIVANTPINKNYTYTFPASYPAITPAGSQRPTACDVNRCYIIAFIYNDATKDVIQVEEAKVIP